MSCLALAENSLYIGVDKGLKCAALKTDQQNNWQHPESLKKSPKNSLSTCFMVTFHKVVSFEDSGLGYVHDRKRLEYYRAPIRIGF